MTCGDVHNVAGLECALFTIKEERAGAIEDDDLVFIVMTVTGRYAGGIHDDFAHSEVWRAVRLTDHDGHAALLGASRGDRLMLSVGEITDQRHRSSMTSAGDTPVMTQRRPTVVILPSAAMPDPSTAALIEGFCLGPFATNCYLVRPGDGSCWIVDASFEPRAMIQRVQELGDTPSAIILTHAHADHIAGLAEVKEAFPEAPVLIHEAEASFLTNPVLNLSAGYGEPLTAPVADRLLKGGETLELGDSSWKVLHTPGHSPGGITLYCEAAKQALVGDTLFAGSIGRYDFPTSDGPTLFKSIQQQLYTLPDDVTAYPGHGPTTTIGREKTTNPFVRGE